MAQINLKAYNPTNYDITRWVTFGIPKSHKGDIPKVILRDLPDHWICALPVKVPKNTKGIISVDPTDTRAGQPFYSKPVDWTVNQKKLFAPQLKVRINYENGAFGRASNEMVEEVTLDFQPATNDQSWFYHYGRQSDGNYIYNTEDFKCQSWYARKPWSPWQRADPGGPKDYWTKPPVKEEHGLVAYLNIYQGRNDVVWPFDLIILSQAPALPKFKVSYNRNSSLGSPITTSTIYFISIFLDMKCDARSSFVKFRLDNWRPANEPIRTKNMPGISNTNIIADDIAISDGNGIAMSGAFIFFSPKNGNLTQEQIDTINGETTDTIYVGFDWQEVGHWFKPKSKITISQASLDAERNRLISEITNNVGHDPFAHHPRTNLSKGSSSPGQAGGFGTAHHPVFFMRDDGAESLKYYGRALRCWLCRPEHFLFYDDGNIVIRENHRRPLGQPIGGIRDNDIVLHNSWRLHAGGNFHQWVFGRPTSYNASPNTNDLPSKYPYSVNRWTAMDMAHGVLTFPFEHFVITGSTIALFHLFSKSLTSGYFQLIPFTRYDSSKISHVGFRDETRGLVRQCYNAAIYYKALRDPELLTYTAEWFELAGWIKNSFKGLYDTHGDSLEIFFDSIRYSVSNLMCGLTPVMFWMELLYANKVWVYRNALERAIFLGDITDLSKKSQAEKILKILDDIILPNHCYSMVKYGYFPRKIYKDSVLVDCPITAFYTWAIDEIEPYYNTKNGFINFYNALLTNKNTMFFKGVPLEMYSWGKASSGKVHGATFVSPWISKWANSSNSFPDPSKAVCTGRHARTIKATSPFFNHPIPATDRSTGNFINYGFSAIIYIIRHTSQSCSGKLSSARGRALELRDQFDKEAPLDANVDRWNFRLADEDFDPITSLKR